MKYTFLLILTIIAISCNSQDKKDTQSTGNSSSQIGQYVTNAFEDSNGNFWFATLEKGVARFDGETFRYFTTDDGLVGNGVVSILEDKDGILWFGTQSGLSKYDGNAFINFTDKEGLPNNNVSNLLIDSKGNFWLGTWGGVCLFDGNTFTDFEIPFPTIDAEVNAFTQHWVTEIMEDSNGNIWFGRDTYGATKFDGSTFIHFTKKDGLPSTKVQGIEEDTNGNIWFGTRVAERDNADPDKRFGNGGLTKFDGNNFVHFPNIDGLSESDVYTIYNDRSGNLWISTTSNGVYKYDGKEFTNYPVSKAVMAIFKDSKNSMWFGCAGGLFRMSSKGIVNITTAGPWE